MKLHLLPTPAHMTLAGGVFRLPSRLRLVRAAGSGRLPASAVAALRRMLRDELGVDALEAAGPRGDIVLTAGDRGPAGSYRLAVGAGGVKIEGRDPAGLFYGVHTLIQLARAAGRDLPRLVVVDEPAFAHRGFYLDISRGKVPKLATLTRLVDRLAALKVNQLQLYVEHVFDFSFDRAIGRGEDPLTPDDIRELDLHCRERFVELVPSLACFGHMGRILGLPRYRKLAELDTPACSWRRTAWIQRLRGATLNPTLPASRALVRRLLAEFLPLFSSGHFNMCGDETYDLGKGRSAGRAARAGIDRLYLDHVDFVRREAARHGKRLMFWGDVMLQHPEAIRRIPRDCVVLDWGYYPSTRFEKVGQFLDAGLEACVCPSTRGYRAVFNDVEEARPTIAAYARTGLALGASGLLNTDWGDMGHFNLLSCSLHGMALGAAMAWNPRSDEGASFDRALSLHVFGDRTGGIARFYSLAGTTGISEWPFLVCRPEPGSITAGRARRAARLVDAIPGWLRALRRTREDLRTERAELALACAALELNAAKTLLERERGTGRGFLRLCRTFAGTLERFADSHAAVWRISNRPAGLRELDGVFRRTARHLARTGEWLYRREDLPGGPVRPSAGSRRR